VPSVVREFSLRKKTAEPEGSALLGNGGLLVFSLGAEQRSGKISFSQNALPESEREQIRVRATLTPCFPSAGRTNACVPYCPVPVTGIICGLPPPVSPTLIVAFSTPFNFGVKVTLIWQLAPPASVPVQF